MKIQKNHIYFALVLGVITVISLFIAELYLQADRKIATLQTDLSDLSDKLTAATSNIQASTSASIASALQAVSKPPTTPPVQTQDELIRQAIDKVSPSVISINISKTSIQAALSDTELSNVPQNVQEVGDGSGIIVSRDGYIVTNNHVVQDQKANYSVILSNGQEMPAQVVYQNPDFDIALIKIAGQNYTPAKLDDSDNIEIGETVEAIGNALGEYNNSVSVGIVSGLHRVIQAANGDKNIVINDAIQTDAAINPGNSGGPLVNLKGNVIGLNVATVAGSSNISFAIPINVIKALIAEQIR